MSDVEAYERKRIKDMIRKMIIDELKIDFKTTFYEGIPHSLHVWYEETDHTSLLLSHHVFGSVFPDLLQVSQDYMRCI